MRQNVLSNWLAKLHLLSSELRDEWRLLVSDEKLHKRIEEWEEHISIFGSINMKQDAPLYKGEGLKFAFNHLNTLDSKFGFLLASQVLLAASVGFSINAFPWEKIGRASSLPARLPHAIWLIVIFMLALLWTVNIILSLSGMYRLVWGGMRRDKFLK